MKITVKESTIVKPMEETPRGSIWLSNLDILMPATYHTRSLYFFSPDGAADFFDAEVLKAALSRALVHFYPFAGRLGRDENGRIEINCNGEGVVFIEAECDGTVADYGYTPRADVPLVPKVDYSQGISTFPLSLLQLTRFECGGVSLGVANEHHVADGIAGLHYINTWSEMARGVSRVTTFTPPHLDRRLLAARNPPQPQFDHIEHHPPPPLKTPLDVTDETSFKTLSLTRDQVNALKIKANTAAAENIRYTSYEAIAGHVWRSVCISRRLPPDQESKLQLPVDGRPRLRPPLPPKLFANGIFYTAAFATCGEMESNPLSFAVGKVQEAVARIENDYMRSNLDYLEVQLLKSKNLIRSGNNVRCPNFGITSWVRLPFYEADFGWGKPIFAGPGEALFEGKSFLFADPRNEGGVLLSISLLKPHMDAFEKLLYDI